MQEIVLFSKLSSIQLLRYFLLSGGAYLLIFRLAPGFFKKYKIQNSEISRHQILHEIKHSLFTVVIFALIFSFFRHPKIKPLTMLYKNISDYSVWWFFLSLPVVILINDTYFYWMHRTFHYPRFYKITHQTHHVSTNPSPLATYSFHPIEAFFEAAWIVPVVFLMPIHTTILIVFALISFLNNLKGHLGVDLMPEKIKRAFPYKWVNTATHHSHHHKYFNSNFGLYFLFWDKLMKTERRS
jgi:sterol desaturase/sphingolipid hydroxylase (fatty acid hydroxylase superfamily)